MEWILSISKSGYIVSKALHRSTDNKIADNHFISKLLVIFFIR